MDYQSQFRAFYDPNLRTEASFSLPGVQYGAGGGGAGGMDIDSLLRTVWGYKQRAAAAEAAREMDAYEQRAALARSYEQEKEAEARRLAEEDRRRMLQASIDGARALHSAYGGAQTWNPARTIADFYEYGAGNPQGRGGGGSATSSAKISDFADERAKAEAEWLAKMKAERSHTPASASDRY